jgi:farnesyl diphosphate synthase
VRTTQPKFEGQKVGLVAVNDSFILEAHVFRLLKKHFRSHPNYIDLVDLFHEVAYQTELGQLLDLTSQPAGDKVDLSLFTLDTCAPPPQIHPSSLLPPFTHHSISCACRVVSCGVCRVVSCRVVRACRYLKIVRYKTAFYSFYLPIALGMYLSGHATEELLAQAKAILLPMGEFFQIQARIPRAPATYQACWLVAFCCLDEWALAV